MKKLPIYCATVGEFNEGIFAVSFVDEPAIGVNFLALAKQERTLKLSIDKQKQILTGALLVPDRIIYRCDAAATGKPQEYYLKFTAADIEKIAAKMIAHKAALSSTTHQHQIGLKGNQLLEIWLVADPEKDKANALGLGKMPKGTLMVSYKVSDAKYWRDEVTSGNVKGFSLEGFFNYKKQVNMEKEKKKVDKKDQTKKGNPVSQFMRAIAALLEGTATDAEDLKEEAGKDETDSGTPYIVFDLADGGEIYVDADGFCTLDGEQMAEGEHELADGNFIVVDADGNLVTTESEAGGEEPTEPTEAELKAAKERGKQVIAAMQKQKKEDGKGKTSKTELSTTNKEIARLKAKLAELEKKPSTEPASPKKTDTAGDEDWASRIAATLRAKHERNNPTK